MKKRLVLAALLFLLSAYLPLAFSGCGFPTGKIEDYTGTYRVTLSYERVTSVHMNAKEVISETEADLPFGATVTVGEDKKVTLCYADGREETGRIRCYNGYARFSGLPVASSYKFARVDKDGAVSLDYQYTQHKGGFFYEYTSRRIVLDRCE